jgi:general secretion pathway protein A
MNRSKFNNYFFSPIRLPWRMDSNRLTSHAFRSQQVPNQPSGLLARNGFHQDASAGEKIKERETLKNRLAAPLIFQAMNVSNEIRLESVFFPQEDLPAIVPEEAVALTAPPTIINANLPPLAQEGPANITEIAAEPEAPNATGPAFHIFTTNSESVRAGNEFETPALWLWDGKDQGANIPDAVNEVEFEATLPPATISATPDFAEISQEQDCAPSDHETANDSIAQPEYLDMAEMQAPEEPGTPMELRFVVKVPALEEPFIPPTLLSFHGLIQQPFDVTPDPSYLYFSTSHREALTAISEGVEHFRGFMALIAEPGMGKTTLLNKLMEELSASARVVFLFQTQCTSSELLAFFLNELEVDHAGMDVVAMHRALNQVLLEEMLRGRRFVLIVDEAQNLQDSVLETIRLLSDFETAHSKLIQIVLAGQPQLVDTLLRPNLVQLRQRIAILSSLKALDTNETAEYIEHRLRAAGWNGHQIFTPEALEEIAKLSGGVPRTINNLCFNALLKAFTRRQEIIDTGIVKEVSRNLHLEGLTRRIEKIAANPIPRPAEPNQSDSSGTAQLAQAISAAIAVAMQPQPAAETALKTQPKPGAVITGKLIEKMSAQSWSKKHEFRIAVSFERDPITGIPVADRHYCCNFYISEEDAAGLQVGKPIRIRIEQE